MIVEYDCQWCGRHARRTRSPANLLKPARFCSQRCNGAARRGSGNGIKPNYQFRCTACGRPCSVYRSPSAQSPRYCSVQCTGLSQRGSANPSFAGGRVLGSHGYVLILAPGHPGADVRGYVYEHRLVMEQVIGRHLNPGEVIHHRNRIRDDNRAENLQLFASHSEHMKLHARENAP